MIRVSCFFILIQVLTLSAWCIASESEGWRPGYVSSIEKERLAVFVDMEMPIQTKHSEMQLKDRIFDQKLTKEFRIKYEQRFGQSSAESAVYRPNSDGQLISAENFVFYYQEESKRRKEFGEYMGRRLTEYHLDNYAKNDPALKPAYQFKEKISSVKLEVAKGYSFDGKYSFSGNDFNIRMKNPYGDVRLVYDQSPDPLVVGELSNDVRIFTGFNLSKKTYLELNYGFVQGDSTMVLRRQLNQHWNGSFLMTSAPYHEFEIPWERRFIAGVSRRY